MQQLEWFLPNYKIIPLFPVLYEALLLSYCVASSIYLVVMNLITIFSAKIQN